MAAVAVRGSPAPRVLVVEDEHAICDLIADMLEGDGIEVQCAQSDREAYLALGAGHGFAALLMDINLGQGTTGFDVARFARQIDNEVPMVFFSGQASEASFKAFGVPNSSFLAKPFTASELRAHLRPILAGD